jgi:hypothetical protein
MSKNVKNINAIRPSRANFTHLKRKKSESFMNLYLDFAESLWDSDKNQIRANLLLNEQKICRD